MQLDSHRRQLSLNDMPCQFFRRCPAATNSTPHDALPGNDVDGPVDDWKTVRRFHLRMMRKQIRSVVLMMALMEALRHGPLQLAYTGKRGFPEPGPEDFGVCVDPLL